MPSKQTKNYMFCETSKECWNFHTQELITKRSPIYQWIILRNSY